MQRNSNKGFCGHRCYRLDPRYSWAVGITDATGWILAALGLLGSQTLSRKTVYYILIFYFNIFMDLNTFRLVCITRSSVILHLRASVFQKITDGVVFFIFLRINRDAAVKIFRLLLHFFLLANSIMFYITCR